MKSNYDSALILSLIFNSSLFKSSAPAIANFMIIIIVIGFLLVFITTVLKGNSRNKTNIFKRRMAV